MLIWFTNKFDDRWEYTVFEMDNDSNYIAWSDDSIEKLMKLKPRRRKHKCLPSESNELHPTIFNVDGKRFTNKTITKTNTRLVSRKNERQNYSTLF